MKGHGSKTDTYIVQVGHYNSIHETDNSLSRIASPGLNSGLLIRGHCKNLLTTH